MSKWKKRRIIPQPPGSNQAAFPASTPTDRIFRTFISHEKSSGILDASTLRAHETRLLGKKNNGPVLIACKKAGLKSVGDIPKTDFRQINKEL